MVDHYHLGRSSLLLASHDKAHREHVHQHHLLHRGDGDIGAVGRAPTEVVATRTVIQQVTVDSGGITIGLHTFTADSTGGIAHPPITTESTTSTTIAASPGTSSSGSTASSTAGSGPGDQAANNAASSSQSLLSIQTIESASTATSIAATPTAVTPIAATPIAATTIAATPISSIPTTFASILASNTTSLIPASSATSSTPSFSNSSISSSTLSIASSSSVFTNLASSTSTISDESSTSSFSSISSISSVSSSPSSSATATATDGIVGGGARTGTGPGNTSTSTAAAGASDDSGSAPSTSTVVGGVVGGVAGAAILILLLMFLIRWKRRNSSMLALDSREGDGTAGTSRSVQPSGPSGGMAERSPFGGFAVPAALASLGGYRRSLQRTADRRTISSTTGSERGFYRVSGRKLPSVLQTGGDGYGGGIMESNTLSGSSFYRDSQGFYGGPGGPSSPPVGLSMPRDSGVPIMREGPARTPVTQQGPWASPPVSLTPPPRRPDVVGRSHSSFDGSQRSRFTEEV